MESGVVCVADLLFNCMVKGLLVQRRVHCSRMKQRHTACTLGFACVHSRWLVGAYALLLAALTLDSYTRSGAVLLRAQCHICGMPKAFQLLLTNAMHGIHTNHMISLPTWSDRDFGRLCLAHAAAGLTGCFGVGHCGLCTAYRLRLHVTQILLCGRPHMLRGRWIVRVWLALVHVTKLALQPTHALTPFRHRLGCIVLP
jgi:hypothetical protein